MPVSLMWSFGNDKLKRTGTVSFNLPAFQSADGFRVCPGAGACAGYCYARQGRYRYPSSIAARELNLAVVRSSLPTFELLAVADLKRIRAKTIRIHDSGDFFSQDYLNSWFAVIRQFPAKRFYCYTKSLHLDWSAQPANLRRVQSAGGRLDRLIDQEQSHTRVFASAADRRAAGYIDGNQTDRPAMNGAIRIGFVYHGSTRLSPALRRYLRKDQR
jgi:hypothetical protein